jgi:type I restriction enzyme M protein
LRWIASTEKDAADQFRANSGLKAQEYSGPILSLIFLRFAEARVMLRGDDHA